MAPIGPRGVLGVRASAWRRASRMLGLVGYVGALATCRRPATEIVLRVDTDIPRGSGMSLTAVRVSFWESDPARTTALNFVLDNSLDQRRTLPADLGLVPDNDESGQVTVDVVAIRGTQELFSRRAIAAYEPGRITLLEVILAGQCERDHARCTGNETCTGGSGAQECQTVTVQHNLPPYVAQGGFGATGSAPRRALCSGAPAPVRSRGVSS